MLWQCSSDEYHADRKRFSNSLFNVLRDDGPAALADALFNGAGTPPTRAMTLGTALHCLCLEHPQFPSRFCLDCRDRFNMRKPAEKEQYQAICAAERRTVLTAEEIRLLHEQAEAIGRHPRAAKAIYDADGISEQTVVWEDEETGVPLKARLDRVSRKRRIIADLKRTESFGPKEWERESWERRYHCQAAHYLDAARQEWPDVDWRFVFVVVSAARPVRVAVREPDADLLHLGWDENRKSIEQIAEMAANNSWWRVETFSAPTWARK